jgi:hypothetical protein
VAQLLVGTNQAIEPEDRVDHLVPDLLLRLDPADELVNPVAVDGMRLVFDEVGDERRAAPAVAVVITQPAQLARPEVEIGLAVQLDARHGLDEREPLGGGLDFPDDNALHQVRRFEVGGAQQLTAAVQLLFTVADHPGKRAADLGQLRAPE